MGKDRNIIESHGLLNCWLPLV